MTTTTSLLAILISLASSAPPVLANSDLTARELLAKLTEAVRWTDHAHIKVTAVVKRWRGGWPAKGSPYASEIYSDGDRLHILYHNFRPNGDVAARFELLVTPQFRIFWEPNGTLDEQSVDYRDSPAAIKAAAGFDRALMHFGWFLDGGVSYVTYNRFDFSVAARAGTIQPEVKSRKIGGLDCQVIEVKGELWDLHAWIVPSRGYNFARYTFDRGPDSTRPGEDHVAVDDISYKQLPDGKWLIDGGTWTDHGNDGKGQSAQFQVVAKRTDIDLSPDFEKLKAFDVPPILNGTAVLYTDVDQDGNRVASHMPYVWIEGYIVPDVVSATTRLLDTPIFGDDPSTNLTDWALHNESNS